MITLFNKEKIYIVLRLSQILCILISFEKKIFVKFVRDTDSNENFCNRRLYYRDFCQKKNSKQYIVLKPLPLAMNA